MPAVVVFPMVLSQSAWAWGIVALVLAALGGWQLATRIAQRGLPVSWLLLVASVSIFLVTPELFLRAAGKRYASGIQFGYPNATTFMEFSPDERLFWKFDSNDPGVNSLGFRGDEITTPKPPGTLRMVFLGDSVTQQGYPDVVEQILNNLSAPNSKRSFEAVTLATSGYSSHQGRVVMEDFVPDLEPDLVFVFFGWNDHWLARGETDAEKRIQVQTSSLTARIGRSIYDNVRILQAANWLRVRLAGGDAPIGQTRVPEAEYEKNLRRIAEVAEKIGTTLVFITAPSAHQELGVPDYLFADNHFAKDQASVLELHRRYNRIAVDVARSEGAPIVDLAASVEALDEEELHSFFMTDGIHLRSMGLAVVSASIAEFVQSWIRGDSDSYRRQASE